VRKRVILSRGNASANISSRIVHNVVTCSAQHDAIVLGLQITIIHVVRIARLIRHYVVSLFPQIGQIVTAMGAPTVLP
jgi:hypothetical protein